MTWFSVFISAIATWQVIEIWRHSSLFADFRARLELYNNYLSNLFLCPWCLSVWVGFGFTGLAVTSEILENSLFLIPAFAFTVSRLANVANDYFHRWCRTPRNIFNGGSTETDEYPF